jgi:enamine deaminase RidA (YjgF/YER057c/UK114 family)
MLAHAARMAITNFSQQVFGLSDIFHKSGTMLECRSISQEGLRLMPPGTEARLQELSIKLPPPPSPGGNYIPARTIGNLVFLSGVVSTNASGIIAGILGGDRTVEEGYEAARGCALTQLAVLRWHLGSLDEVKSIISVNGYVNAVAGFKDSPEVINGASNLFVEVFGDAGRHVRAAIGVSALPRNALVELQMSVEI